MKTLYAALLLATTLALAVTAHAAGSFIEGMNYRLVEPPQPVDAAPGTVEVVEFLWYDCQSCFVVQPALERWLGGRGDVVSFRRMPAVVGGHMVFHARTFFAAETLGVLDRVHMPLYTALHRHGRKLDEEELLAEFFAEHGVDRTRFLTAFRGSATAARVRNAQLMSRRYELQGAPSFVVNGKYRVDATMVRNAEMLLEVVDYLVDRELAAGGR
jgi:protein dithiol oxidoreductase (disulfide-forming)